MAERIIVKGLNWIGDAVMSSPFFESLKKGNPKSSIVVLSRPWTAEIYKNNRYIDKVVEIDDKKNKIEAIKFLKKEKFDAGILLPKSLSAALLFKLGNVKKISGWSAQFRNFIISNPVSLTKNLKSIHQVYLHLELAYANSGVKLEKPEIFLDTSKSTDEQIKKKYFNRKNVFYLGINPGASFGPAKRWKPEYFADVINRLNSLDSNMTPVFFGSSNEISISESIIKSLNKKIEYVNLAGATTLQELFSAIKQCSYFLTNDSGPMHIAAALKIPLTAIFGSTNDKTTGPFSSNSIVVKSGAECSPCISKKCRFNTYKCMNDITPDMVLGGIAGFLKNFKG
ncbi:MAG TPA: lipopolysaccharide heptosyltransferase II [bacterium]|nr:lipopolysaccharide heptosyltransferase II [bacterium]